MLVDSHCHLDRVDLSPYGGDFGAMLGRAGEEDVGHMLCVCIDLEHYAAMRRLVSPFPNVSVSVGVHPSEQGGDEPSLDDLVRLGSDPDVVAIGETGLDYHYNRGDLEWQRERFRTHIEAAKTLAKPLIIHTRDARDDTIAVMRDAGADAAGGVMHCFTETWEMAQQALDLGFYISFSGILTFKNAESLREVARSVPLERLLIETDSPYLAPVPHRGKKNEPRFVTHVAAQVAELRGLSVEAVAELTTENFFRLFTGAAKPPSAAA
ncbi:TatD family hydrolase [Lamprobacter modestohalophilus]|uniref:TatD family hydrolase n=1 Tax=Lamprobacter modestohalophilus TaxID=1064514 RepID=UPI002ADEAB11|nr:TatD family hydrolase [Lamprobacter modestohalophilus]MEA1049737.1 TatD family hydrolase [Lamprobacter modestohalophilus]